MMQKLFLFLFILYSLPASVYSLEAGQHTYLFQSDTLVLQPGAEGKDCYICDCSPDVNSPNGGKTLLYQGQYQTCYDRLLIQWDISSLPPNINIIKAEMQLYCYNRYGARASGKMTYYRITSFWNEDSVCYNTKPDTCHDVSVTINQWPGGGKWHAVDITQFVQGWYQGNFPNYGIYGHCLQTSGTCVAGFYSSDHSNHSERPKLIVIYSSATEVADNDKAPPEKFQLSQNYPNPFNSRTTINCSIPTGEFVTLKLYDSIGREVAVLIDEHKTSGNYLINLDAKNLPSGVYFFRLKAGSFVDTKKAILMR